MLALGNDVLVMNTKLGSHGNPSDTTNERTEDNIKPKNKLRLDVMGRLPRDDREEQSAALMRRKLKGKIYKTQPCFNHYWLKCNLIW